jgi:hypothetical protein
MTETLKKRFAAIGPQMDTGNPIIIAKFFNPTGAVHGMP